MSSYVLTCCSTADMPYEYFEKRNIPYVCFHYNLEGKEYPDDLGKTISFEEFYHRVATGAMPTTSLVNVGEFINFFEPFLKDGKDILHISVSSGLSGVYNSARIAKDELLLKYPSRKILLLDSLGVSSGYGLLMDIAADLRDEGLTIDDVYSRVEERKLSVHHWFFSSDLSHYRRGGRVSTTSEDIETLLMCQLLSIGYDGKPLLHAKIRGKRYAIEQIVHMMEVNAENRKEYSSKCFVAHSACYDDARKVADLIESKFPLLNGPVMINNVGAVNGSHAGPGTVALFFLGDNR